MADAQVGTAPLPGQGLSYNVTNERGWNDPPPLAFGGASGNGAASRKRIDPRKRVAHNLNGTVDGSPSHPAQHSPAVQPAHSQSLDSPVASTLSSLTDYFQKAASFVTGDDSSGASVGKIHYSNSDPDFHLPKQLGGVSYPDVTPGSAHASSMPEMPHNFSVPNFVATVDNGMQQNTLRSSADYHVPRPTWPHLMQRGVTAAALAAVDSPGRGCQSGPPSLTVFSAPWGPADACAPSVLPSVAVPVQLGSHPRARGSTPPLVRTTQTPSASSRFAFSATCEPTVSTPRKQNFGSQSADPPSAGRCADAQASRSLLTPLGQTSRASDVSRGFAQAPEMPSLFPSPSPTMQYSSMPADPSVSYEAHNLGFARSLSTPGFPVHRLSPTAALAGPPPTQGYYSHRALTGKGSPSHIRNQCLDSESKSDVVGSDQESMRATVAALQGCLEGCAAHFTNRTLDDIAKRIQCFQQMWLQGKLSAAVKAKMSLLVEAVKKGDFQQADSIHKTLVLEHASEVMQWMVGVKKLIITSQQTSIESGQEQAPLT